MRNLIVFIFGSSLALSLASVGCASTTDEVAVDDGKSNELSASGTVCVTRGRCSCVEPTMNPGGMAGADCAPGAIWSRQCVTLFPGICPGQGQPPPPPVSIPPSQQPCGTGLRCSVTPLAGGGQCLAGGGVSAFCCPSGSIISNNTCVALPACDPLAGFDCRGEPVAGAIQCAAPTAPVAFCCPQGQHVINGRCESAVAAPPRCDPDPTRPLGLDCANKPRIGSHACTSLTGSLLFCCAPGQGHLGPFCL